MKQLFFLHKRLLVAPVLAGLLFTATSFSYGPAGEARLVGDPPQKKEQRVKVIVSTDGKVTKIDTTFNLPDEKMIRSRVDSLLKTMGLAGIESGKMESLFLFGGPDGDMLPPPPPPPSPLPPHAQVIIHKRSVGDPFAYDAKDESIISYDKKDIGKGLEKITIIRKKQVEQQQEKKVEVKVDTSDDTKK